MRSIKPLNLNLFEGFFNSNFVQNKKKFNDLIHKKLGFFFKSSRYLSSGRSHAISHYLWTLPCAFYPFPWTLPFTFISLFLSLCGRSHQIILFTSQSCGLAESSRRCQSAERLRSFPVQRRRRWSECPADGNACGDDADCDQLHAHRM